MFYWNNANIGVQKKYIYQITYLCNYPCFNTNNTKFQNQNNLTTLTWNTIINTFIRREKQMTWMVLYCFYHNDVFVAHLYYVANKLVNSWTLHYWMRVCTWRWGSGWGRRFAHQFCTFLRIGGRIRGTASN